MIGVEMTRGLHVLKARHQGGAGGAEAQRGVGAGGKLGVERALVIGARELPSAKCNESCKERNRGGNGPV